MERYISEILQERTLNCPFDNGCPRCPGCSVIKTKNGEIIVKKPDGGCDYKNTLDRGNGIKAYFRRAHGSSCRDNVPKDILDSINLKGTLGIGKLH